MLAFRFQKFGDLVKGTDEIITEDGQLQSKAMRRNQLSERDFSALARLRGFEGMKLKILRKVGVSMAKVCTTPAYFLEICAAVILGGGWSGNWSFNLSSSNR